MAWTAPKTNWVPPDGVADVDLNRIEGNILELKKAATIDIVDAGNIITATTVEAALQEVGTDMINSKAAVAASIAAMGTAAASTDAMATLASKVRDISKDANAVVGHVLNGETFYQGGTKKTGTLTSQPAGVEVASIASNEGNIWARFPMGAYITGGNGGQPNPEVHLSDPDFIAANFRADKNIYGLQGSMPNQSTKVGGLGSVGRQLSPGLYSQAGRLFMKVPTGFWDDPALDNSWVYFDDADFAASNIRNGVDLFGIVGNVVAGQPKASGTVTADANGTVTVTGLAFAPKLIVLYAPGGPPTMQAIWVDQSVWGIPYTKNIWIQNDSSAGTNVFSTVGASNFTCALGSTYFANRSGIGWAAYAG